MSGVSQMDAFRQWVSQRLPLLVVVVLVLMFANTFTLCAINAHVSRLDAFVVPAARR